MSRSEGVTKGTDGTALGYRAGLDGVRALAVAAVMVTHSGIPGTGGGGLGVDVFFALSGFLITTLLLDEWRRDSRIGFGGFYMRRALRLLPALVLLVAVVGTYAVFADGGEAERTVDGIVPTLLYLTNWFATFGHDFGGLHHTWSLAIEEQFYLVWPPVLWVLLRRGASTRRMAIGVGMVAAMSAGGRLVAWLADASPAAVYQGIHFRASALLLGVTAALVAPALLRRLASLRLAVPAFVVLGGTILCPLDAVRAALGSVVVAAATCVVIAHVVHGPQESFVNRILRHRSFVWTGRRSYGLYLWHWPIFLFMAVETHAARFPLATLLAVFAAAASARWVEFPFLRMKQRYGRTDAPIAAPI